METLIEKAEAKEALIKQDESEAAKYFIPNSKSEKFIKMVGTNETFINMFVGANATSKTSTGANILANICYGVQNEWFDYPLFQKFPYIKKGRIISDPTTIKEKIIPELKKWFPKSDAVKIPEATFETAKEGKNYEAKFFTNTGFEIDLLSNEQALTEFESVDLGFVWFDEPCPKDKFMATIARGRLGMVVIMTYTPLFHSGWLKDYIDEKMDGKFVNMVEAEMEDNCKIHGVRGFLEHVNIKRIADAFPADEKEARVFGRFGHLIGRVHKKFKREIHVIRPFPLNPKDFTVYQALDPHPRVPDHGIWMAVDRNGTKFICSEIRHAGTTKELAERMKAHELSMKFRMADRIIDPSAFVDDQHREDPSVGSKLLEFGLHFIKGSKDLQAGIKRLDDALDYQVKGGEMIVKPEIFIFDTCRITIKQLEEYVWEDWVGRGADSKQPKSRPRDKEDHQVENLHRILLHEPKFIPYIPNKGTIRQEEMKDLDPYAS